MKRYPALAFRGSPEASVVVLFAASATDIVEWSGVPQREQFDEGQETIGFQREENQKRLSQLARFFSDAHNVAQNPLLCAQRSESTVRFVAETEVAGALVHQGHIEIDDTNYSGRPLTELFEMLDLELQRRQPALKGAAPSIERMRVLQERLQREVGVSEVDLGDDTTSDPDAMPDDEGVAGLFMSETHVLEFWQEVRIRHDLLKGLEGATRSAYDTAESFLGFERDALVSYLKPVFLVDGQHRLRGAVLAAEKAATERLSTPMVMERIDEGADPEILADELTRAEARLLPVSMLMNTNYEEHVFQFVVVNQKATPVGKALLGTIVATSLTEDELENVTDRLEQVQINVSDSQAVAWFTRNRESAFYGQVQQGIENEGSQKLRWSVLRDLVSVFRNLQGGKLFHSPRNDYADKWRRRELVKSALVSAVIEGVPEEDQLTVALEAWQALDGPWRDVANAFFLEVRDRLADASNAAANNGWGGLSNIYNKISLTILVADFFQWLTDKDKTINSAAHCRELVAEWLTGIDKAYFNRDWNLSGVKRESTGIRNQWSELWNDYRKDAARIPAVTNFRKPKQG